MADANKRNLHYFEGLSMRELYATIDAWQSENKRRLLSLNVQREGDRFCCIVLTNPMEVIIMDGFGEGGVDVSDHALKITSG